MVYKYKELEQGIYRIDLEKSLVNSEATLFNESIDDLFNERQGRIGIILDFQKCKEKFASDSQGVLIALYKRIKLEKDGGLALLNTPDYFLRIMNISGLDTIIENYVSEEQAKKGLLKILNP